MERPASVHSDDGASIHSISLSAGDRSSRSSHPLEPPHESYTRTTPSFFEFSPGKNRGSDPHRFPDPALDSRVSTRDSYSERASGADELAGHVFDDLESSATRDTSLPTSPKATRDSYYHQPVEDLTSSSVYPPLPPRQDLSRTSLASSAKKIRPESLLVDSSAQALILGVALVDFNHLQGPQIEWSQGRIFDDREVAEMLPFLALPDGAHMNVEDYSYFHLVPSSPNPCTVFGISCNRQISSESLLVKSVDVTRSVVQKAIVVVASKPIFGAIRDKLGVVTRAFFEQRDFSETSILSDFHSSLEVNLRSHLTESTFYSGTNLRALVHNFRHRTLVLLKALLAQKKIMFYGHPVEVLCTYQYSLISLIPGLLRTLDDCGSPPLSSRAATLSLPTSLKTSDRKSMLNYLGLPLDVFGKDAFFQPYLPLQQADLLQETSSWLCGTTNSIITQVKYIDVFVNIEEDKFEFRNPQAEKLVTLTAADRAWIDEIVRDVNENWDADDQSKPQNMQFKGSEDYIRSKFEEYITSALATIKYNQFVAKGEKTGVIISGGSASDASSWQQFHPGWMQSLKTTNAYEVWNRVTDPMLFDIVDPSHPGSSKVTTISDIGLRLQEGLYELKLEQQLAPTREKLNNAFASGSTSLLKAMDGVKGRWQARRPSATSMKSTSSETSSLSTPVEVSKPDTEELAASPTKSRPASMRELASPISAAAAQAGTRVSSWGAGWGSFISSKAARFTSREAAQDGDRRLGASGGNTTDESIPSPVAVRNDHSGLLSAEIEDNGKVVTTPGTAL